MKNPKTVQAINVLAAKLQADGFVRRGRVSWYRRGADLIQVVNLQKSQWGEQYYVNVSYWLLPLGSAKWPREQDCHVRMRCDDAIRSGRRIHQSLDAEYKGKVDVATIVVDELLPFLKATSTTAGLAARSRRSLLRRVAVVLRAQRLLGID